VVAPVELKPRPDPDELPKPENPREVPPKDGVDNVEGWLEPNAEGFAKEEAVVEPNPPSPNPPEGVPVPNACPDDTPNEGLVDAPNAGAEDVPKADVEGVPKPINGVAEGAAPIPIEPEVGTEDL